MEATDCALEWQLAAFEKQTESSQCNRPHSNLHPAISSPHPAAPQALKPGAAVSEVFDVSPPDGPGVLAGFLYNGAALDLTEEGPEVVQKAVLEAWSEFMGDTNINNPLNFV